MKRSPAGKWPVLRRYEGEMTSRIALPIGGIGTGTIALGGRGNLLDFELMNRPAKGYVPQGDHAGPTFAALRWTSRSKGADARLLEGPLPLERYEGQSGSPEPWHGLPRFRRHRFETAYPFGQVQLSDPDVPVTVTLQAFNPLIPPDLEKSGLPLAVFRYVVRSKTREHLRISLCFSLPNFIGKDGFSPAPSSPLANRIAFREEDSLRGLFYWSDHADTKHTAWGTMALVTPDPGPLSFRTCWDNRGSWGGGRLDFWDDLREDGRLDNRDGTGEHPMGSLCLEKVLPAGRTTTFTFILTWHFPNRYAWNGGPNGEPAAWVGNYYTTQYADAWEAAVRLVPRLPDLERESLQFVQTFLASDHPDVIKEAALFNLSTLRTQTCFRTADGHFFGFEGCSDQSGCCFGSCTHVWNYETATAFLFGPIARDMRTLEFEQATDEIGLMSFRISLPIDPSARQFGKAAADGQMGCLIKLYREWRLQGDDAFLRRLWPAAKRALAFAWRKGCWDADHDGVMEGCQHNTMDVEYYGPNPQMEFWYLGALRAAEEMARAVGENDFAEECHRLFENGRQTLATRLFNGHYYRHEIQPIPDRNAIHPGLLVGMGSDPANLIFQLGDGCLVDQLVGQVIAHTAGLGVLAPPNQIRKTLRSILRFNRKRGFWDHFNPMRGFALGDEEALIMAAYPHGRLRIPFPYYAEVMTGFEYIVAVHLLMEGMEKEGLRVIRAIRDRYDGRRRNPFDEAECGHHYARAMASWTAIPAWSGFDYSAIEGRLTFALRPGLHFWAAGDAWGLARIQRAGKRYIRVSLDISAGALPALSKIQIRGAGTAVLPPHSPRAAPAHLRVMVPVSPASPSGSARP